MLKHLVAANICLLCGLADTDTAHADTIYKCTDGGRISYHDRPCGQNAVALNVQAAPAAPEVLERLARERALVQKIEAERAVREEREQREAARALREALAGKRRCDRLRLQQKWADEDVRRAGKDEAERARTKARRQAEALAVECPA